MRIEAAARLHQINADWWSNMSQLKQELYIKKHPRSKKANDIKPDQTYEIRDKKSPESKSSTPKAKPKSGDRPSTKPVTPPVPTSKIKPKSKPATTVQPVSGEAAHKAMKNKFSAKEVKSITDYSSDATNPKEGRFKPMYQAVNQGLRGNTELSPDAQAATRALDDTFKDASTSEPVEVYRGLEDAFADQLELGSSFKDKGFVSTSSNPRVASDFAAGKKTVLKINVPKGSKAISVAGQSAYPDEEEILLNRGGSFKVTDITTDAKGVKTVHVEYTDE